MATDRQRVADAKTGFVRLIIWTVAAGILMSIVAVSFLSYTAGPLTGAMLAASILGVFFSVFLGAGLMAVGFLSSNSGHDDTAADHRDRNSPPGR